MIRPEFSLVVVATSDGFIARHPGHSPAEWASPEEQAHFFAEVEAADWSVMGRGTHQAADRPDRRRILFSSSVATPVWRRPTQLWLDPAGLTPDDLPALVAEVQPMRRAAILGATRVHDWFLHHRRIDRVMLSIEPLRFTAGLPLFTGHSGPPDAVLHTLGFRTVVERQLNPAGTRLIEMRPG